MTTSPKRINKTVINTIGAELRDGKIYGARVNLSFTVAMNAEEAKANNFKQIENLTVKIDGVKLEELITEGVKAWKVKHQTPMRNHITEVEKLNGTTVGFNDTLFASAGRSTVISEAQAETVVMNKGKLEKVQLAIKLMKSSGMAVPDALLEEEILLKMEAEETDPTTAAE